MATYNYPNATGLGPYEFISWIAGVDTLIFPVIFLVTFGVIFISTMRFGAFKAGVFSMFMLWIMTLCTGLMGWTSTYWFTGASILLVMLLIFNELFDNAKG